LGSVCSEVELFSFDLLHLTCPCRHQGEIWLVDIAKALADGTLNGVIIEANHLPHVSFLVGLRLLGGQVLLQTIHMEEMAAFTHTRTRIRDPMHQPRKI
jgi:hypothetical protein